MEDILTQNIIQRLSEHIMNSSLSQEDKLVWANGIERLDEKTAQDILSYLEELPEDIQWATEMLKRKVEALKNNDISAWNQILTEERIKLESITTNE